MFAEQVTGKKTQTCDRRTMYIRQPAENRTNNVTVNLEALISVLPVWVFINILVKATEIPIRKVVEILTSQCPIVS